MSNKPIVITIASNKGGVGKTATASSFTYLLGRKNKVLLIDTDPQGNCAGKFGIEEEEGIGKLGEYINNRTQDAVAKEPLDNYLVHYDKNIAVLYGGKSVKTKVYDIIYSHDPQAAMYMFRDLVDEIANDGTFDYVIIDTSAAFGNEIYAILNATDWVLSPTLAETDSVAGFNTLLKFVNSARRSNPNLKIAGLFFNQVSDRSKAQKAMEPFSREAWKDKVFNTRIPYNPAAIYSAIIEADPVTKKYPKSKSSLGFKKLLKELLDKINAEE